jgi:hypothetical protein
MLKIGGCMSCQFRKGLDIGTNSVGWALINESDKPEILALHNSVAKRMLCTIDGATSQPFSAETFYRSVN